MHHIRHRRFIVPALAAAVLLAAVNVLAASADFLDLRRIEALHGDAEAGKSKATVCAACHGAAGISAVPLFPNLAGQRGEYLYWQLVEFKREARPDSPMTAQVAALDISTLQDLAMYFASLPASTPALTGDASAAARARDLYRNGDSARGVPPCQGCHGTDASGHPLAQDEARYRAYPALRGQHAGYLAQRLKDFRDGKRTFSSSDRIMTSVAHALDDESIQALAGWLESGAP